VIQPAATEAAVLAHKQESERRNEVLQAREREPEAVAAEHGVVNLDAHNSAPRVTV
jgi:hypothetical protein